MVVFAATVLVSAAVLVLVAVTDVVVVFLIADTCVCTCCITKHLMTGPSAS